MSNTCQHTENLRHIQRDTNEIHDSDRIKAVTRFLKTRFSENARMYQGSFAMELNNESAIQLAELLFSPKTAKRALSNIMESESSNSLHTIECTI